MPEAINPVMMAKGTSSIYVWASNSDSCRFWRILSKLNIKVIGKKELKHYHLENGMKIFPEDYPKTLAFKNYLSEEKEKNFRRYKRTPLPKRPNYIGLNSPYPFGPIIPKEP